MIQISLYQADCGLAHLDEHSRLLTRAMRLFMSEVMVDEFKDVISRSKFKQRLDIIHKSAEEIVNNHLRFTQVINAQAIPPIIVADPDDDFVLACALEAKADYIVSGDSHLLELKLFQNIPILTVNDFLERFVDRNES